jgi:hypothetical protein
MQAVRHVTALSQRYHIYHMSAQTAVTEPISRGGFSLQALTIWSDVGAHTEQQRTHKCARVSAQIVYTARRATIT